MKTNTYKGCWWSKKHKTNQICSKQNSFTFGLDWMKQMLLWSNFTATINQLSATYSLLVPLTKIGSLAWQSWDDRLRACAMTEKQWR